jgi:ribosomal protein S18 acetylase RimI-like enzyme
MEKPAVEYRTVVGSDYNQCISIVASVFNSSETSSFRKSWKEKQFKFSFLALTSGIPIGCAIVTKDNCIQYLAIDPDYQGFGIGSQLLRKVCEEMSDQPSIWLKTADSPWLRKWYEGHGFTHEKTYLSKTGEYQGDCMIRRQRGRNKQMNQGDGLVTEELRVKSL